MDDNMRIVVTMANGCAMMMAQLVDQLDKRGVIAKAEFADGLARLAELGEEIDVGAKIPRIDLMMMRNCVAVLRGEEEQVAAWVPRVIDGGKDSQD